MNGETLVTSLTLDETNDWTGSATVPLTDETGKTASYTWVEETVTGYTLTSQKILGNTTILTNTHKPELTRTTVAKIWDDNDNAAGYRPATLRVTLSNGSDYILSEENNWTVTVEGLPKYYDGEEIVYTWSEQSVLMYKQKSIVINDEVTVFTNTYIAPPSPPVPSEPGKPLGIGVIIINHVGDCFD